MPAKDSIGWKLIFTHPNPIQPGIDIDCQVQPAYMFRGTTFYFESADFFEVKAIRIGTHNQLAYSPVPCTVLHGMTLSFVTILPSFWCQIVARNISDKPVKFYAEFHGKIEPVDDSLEQSWERRIKPLTRKR